MTYEKGGKREEKTRIFSLSYIIHAAVFYGMVHGDDIFFDRLERLYGQGIFVFAFLHDLRMQFGGDLSDNRDSDGRQVKAVVSPREKASCFSENSVVRGAVSDIFSVCRADPVDRRIFHGVVFRQGVRRRPMGLQLPYLRFVRICLP